MFLVETEPPEHTRAQFPRAVKAALFGGVQGFVLEVALCELLRGSHHERQLKCCPGRSFWRRASKWPLMMRPPQKLTQGYFEYS